MRKLTASKLYDYLQCPHKVWRDANGPQEEKSQEVNSFVKMLWTRGVAHEEQIVAELGQYLDLSEGSLDERFRKTTEAIENGEEIIYQGVLKFENYLGIPDILKKMPDGKYFPIDIKSGSGFEGVDDGVEEGKPKKHYAVQLCFYIELLQKLETGMGAYTESKGPLFAREAVAEFINSRDAGGLHEGFCAANPEHIFLTNGASEGAKNVIEMLISGKSDGIMVPVPQYPLYSATVCRCGGVQVSYYPDEEKGWKITPEHLAEVHEKAVKDGVRVKAIVVINPGNPTGAVLDAETIENIIRFATEKQLHPRYGSRI